MQPPTWHRLVLTYWGHIINRALCKPRDAGFSCRVSVFLTMKIKKSWRADSGILKPREKDNASYFGRIFARTGGLSEAVVQALKEQNIDFEVKAEVCDGIEQCKIALLKKNKNLLNANFIEGMSCVGGCIGGAGCLTHGEKNKAEVDKYGREALEKSISDALFVIKK